MSDATTHTPQERLNLGPVQRRRRLALLLAMIAYFLALPFIHSIGAGEGVLHEGLEIFGMVLISCAIVGRSWCTLYIGGRKRHEIVASGPYSISRNPLYVFSLLAILGIGLQTGSLVMGLLATAIGFAIFYPVIRREEEMLSSAFGADYANYSARVPRFGPNFSLWRDMETIMVHPRRLRQTFLEATIFLLAMPVCEAIEVLQDSGYLTPLLHLP
jgi:protein-S-isoprenylcysteine O-methyltransferase Ste14